MPCRNVSHSVVMRECVMLCSCVVPCIFSIYAVLCVFILCDILLILMYGNYALVLIFHAYVYLFTKCIFVNARMSN